MATPAGTTGSARPLPAPTKSALRATATAQRRDRSEIERDQLARSIAAVALELPQLRRARCVAVYASLPQEPSTLSLRAGLHGLRTRVLLPIVADGRELDWAQDDDGELTPSGRLNLPEPAGPRLGAAGLGDAGVIIVPALAVDTLGTRLGRGRGFYDTALLHARADALILALVHDQELLDARTTPIPREPHDRRVHGVITPSRWILFSPTLP